MLETRSLIFCEGNPIYLETQNYTANTDLLSGQFKYVWEYHYDGDDITETTYTPVRTSTSPECYNSGALVDTRDNNATLDPNRNYNLCGNYLYDTDCYECQSETRIIDGRWYSLGDETPSSSTLWTAARRSGYTQVAFRYRLKHITNGQVGPPSNPTGYVTIYDPPPTLNYTDNTEPNFSTAADSVYDNGDLRVEHVSCQNGGNGQIIIKNLSGNPGREYFYTLRGPITNPDEPVTNARGGLPWNVNGQSRAAPRPDQEDTWITFPDDDPSGSAQLKAGTYWLIIENWDRRPPNADNNLANLDLRACFVARKVTVKEPDTVLAVTPSPKTYAGFSVSCHGASDGEVTLTASGGIPPYRYYLREKETGGPFRAPDSVSTFTGLRARRGAASVTYEYYTIDAMGCRTTTQTLPLTEPPPLEINYITKHHYPDASTGPYHIQCHGATDSVTVAVRGGVAPYEISINGTNYTATADNPIITAAGLATGTYAVRVTDENDCTVNGSVQLDQPPPLKIAEATAAPPACAGGDDGNIFLKARQGIPLNDGQYVYSLRHTAVPPEYQSIFAAEQSITDTTALFTGLIEGTYQVTIQDRYRCSFDTTITLTPPPPLLVSGRTKPITCRGDEDGALWVAASGGTPPYRLDFVQQGHRDTLRTTAGQYDSLFALPSKQYRVHVTDANGCRAQVQLNVRSPQQPLSLTVDTVRQVSPISCAGANDGRVQLTATGGWTERPYRYGRHLDSLSEGQMNYRQLGPSLHTFYVQDAQGCTDSVRITLREPEALEANVVATRNIFCSGTATGRIELNVTGGTRPYRVSHDRGASWQPTTRLEGLRAGSYELWVADESDCRAAALVVTLTEPPLLGSRVVSQEDTRCGLAEGAASVSVSGGVAPYEVQWHNETGTAVGTGFSVNKLSSGRYTAHIRDANRCADTLSVTISDRDGPVVRVSETQAVRCAGESNGAATIEISGGAEPLTIRWDDGQTELNATNLAGGEHWVEVQDANGCRVFLTVPIGEPFPLEIITERQADPVCPGEGNGQLAVLAQGGNGNYQYAWSTGATTRTLTDRTAGTYVVTVTDEQGCQAQDTLRLRDPETIIPTLPDTLLLCYGQRATLDAGYAGHNYAWTSTIGQRGQDQTLFVENPGTYEVTVTNERGCQGTKSTEVIYSNELLKAEFLMSSQAQTGDTVVLVDISWPTPESTHWDYGTDADLLESYEVYQELIYDQPGTYQVTLRAWVGECEDEITKSITITESTVVPENGRSASADFIRAFYLLPNPSSGRFVAHIELQEVAPVRLYLTDLNSKGMVAELQKDGQSVYEVAYDLAHLSAGVYLLTLRAEDEVRTQRVVIH